MKHVIDGLGGALAVLVPLQGRHRCMQDARHRLDKTPASGDSTTSTLRLSNTPLDSTNFYQGSFFYKKKNNLKKDRRRSPNRSGRMRAQSECFSASSTPPTST